MTERLRREPIDNEIKAEILGALEAEVDRGAMIDDEAVQMGKDLGAIGPVVRELDATMDGFGDRVTEASIALNRVFNRQGPPPKS